jgi:hypothetical protein
MNYENTHNKIRAINNLIKSTAEEISELEIEQISQDKNLDIKQLLIDKRIITLTSGWQNITIIPTEDESVDEGGYCHYNLTLLACPLYLIPYIKIITIAENSTTAYENASYIRILDIEDAEEIVNEDGSINTIEKSVQIFCAANTASDEGIKIKFIINIFNPREFK